MQVRRVEEDGLVDVVLAASQVLVGLADRSLPEVAGVTLHQFRALALLAAHEELNVNSLADLLRVSPSTITRLCDRLVGKKLIRRRRAKTSRREVCLSVSPTGAALVEEVMTRRRAAIEGLLDRMPPSAHVPLAQGLGALVAAGQVGVEAEVDVDAPATSA